MLRSSLLVSGDVTGGERRSGARCAVHSLRRTLLLPSVDLSVKPSLSSPAIGADADADLDVFLLPAHPSIDLRLKLAAVAREHFVQATVVAHARDGA
jgi:hypothetical protein